MQIETAAGRGGAPENKPSARTGASDGGGRRWKGPRARAIARLVTLAGTAFTGLVLHGRTPHGDAWDAAPVAPGGPSGFLVLHVLLASCFVAALAWHLVDKRRVLFAFARRGSARNLRCLLTNAMLAALFVASLLTAFSGDTRSRVIHHTAVSMVLVVAYGWHGVRRMVRRYRAARRMVAGAA